MGFPALALSVLLAGCGEGGVGPAAADSGPLRLLVRGARSQWLVTYPGADGTLGTRDDVHGQRDLHVPAHTAVEVALESADYVYGFRIPDFRVNQVAVPALPFSASFVAGPPGRHRLKGDRMCGFRHDGLLGSVVVHGPADFGAWLARQAP